MCLQVQKQAGRGDTAIVFSGGQLRVQVHPDVLVEGDESSHGAIMKIVGAVHVLPAACSFNLQRNCTSPLW